MTIHVQCPNCGAALKTSDEAAGKQAKCPYCQTIVPIPLQEPSDEIVDAVVDPEEMSIEQGTEQTTERRKPCPACGEMILKDAVKCRYCGEIFDPALQRLARAKDGDSDLTKFEWAFAILCSSIACILGIVWMIQGKPKGKKMFFVSLAMQFFWGFVRVLIEVGQQGQFQ